MSNGWAAPGPCWSGSDRATHNRPSGSPTPSGSSSPAKPSCLRRGHALASMIQCGVPRVRGAGMRKVVPPQLGEATGGTARRGAGCERALPEGHNRYPTGNVRLLATSGRFIQAAPDIRFAEEQAADATESYGDIPFELVEKLDLRMQVLVNVKLVL